MAKKRDWMRQGKMGKDELHEENVWQCRPDVRWACNGGTAAKYKCFLYAMTYPTLQQSSLHTSSTVLSIKSLREHSWVVTYLYPAAFAVRWCFQVDHCLLRSALSVWWLTFWHFLKGEFVASPQLFLHMLQWISCTPVLPLCKAGGCYCWDLWDGLGAGSPAVSSSSVAQGEPIEGPWSSLGGLGGPSCDIWHSLVVGV